MNLKNFGPTGFAGDMDDVINGFTIVGAFNMNGNKELTRFDGQVSKDGVHIFDFTSVFVRRPEEENSRLVFRIQELADTGMGAEALASLTTCREKLIEKVQKDG